jgi:hypothetical protein
MFCYVYLVAMADDLDPLAAIRDERSTFAKNERKLSGAAGVATLKTPFSKLDAAPASTPFVRVVNFA